MNNIHRILALGFFDGVHLGHQSILAQAAEAARQKGVASGAVTFQQHPQSLVGGAAPRMITTYNRRMLLILGCGIDEAISLPFDRKMADMPPQDFIRMLIKDLGAVGIACGENFRFGKSACGTPADFEAAGLEVHVCPKVLDEDGATISSTAIRRLVEAGDMPRAARYLGRPFAMEGTVAHGRKVGRKLGFPTMNLTPESGMLLPLGGVYASLVRVGGQQLAALTNVGCRPTFQGGGEISVESHIPGFEGELYGRHAIVELLRFIRPERAFASAQELAQQITRDLAQIAEPGK